ncbi:SoxR reducing system RseC family protein [Parabacteroides sp. FAFU027]|uniref:SoxR reducing system RseC family protein n=1 Tax=Parabacteroides sp. FAFU027 TaxID=2922715 RepID=UPI001FAFA1B7|nr:SoxR reducing system RseC family protein [Parabacteroides sp. FAFU027]
MIQHEGTIIELNEAKVTIRLYKQSACAGCHAKGSCSVVDQSEIILDLPLPPENLHIGQKVLLEGSVSMGMQAIVYAFVIPLVILIFTLVIFQHYFFSELISGAVSLLMLVPYYLVLYLKRDTLKRKFVFRIKTGI